MGVYIPAEASDEDLVVLARAGQEAALEALLNRYRHYARAKARSYFLAGADRDDIVQEGMIGLFKAVRDFDAERNVTFRVFAELCIGRQIITAIKSATRQKHIPLNSYVSLSYSAGDGDAEPHLPDSLRSPAMVDPAELVISAQEIADMRSSMNRHLSGLENEVLELYMEGKSYQQIADMLGRHVKSIDNALQRIKRKVEQHVLVRDRRGRAGRAGRAVGGRRPG